LRVLRVGVIRCAILSCVVVDDDEVSIVLILLSTTPLLVILRCEIDEGDSIDEGVKALHIDSRVMAAINSSNIVIFIVIFCKEE